MSFGLVVIGGGLTACAASAEAARAGARVLQVPVAGGDGDLACTRAALFRAVLREEAERALCAEGPRPGGARPAVDLRASTERALHAALSEAYAELGKLGVTVREGSPRLDAEGGVALDGAPLAADAVFLATGSRARRPRRFPFDGRAVLEADAAWRLGHPPRAALVVGGEEAGCALAGNLAALGSAVTLVDRRTRLLRHADRDLLERLHRALGARGVTVVLGEGIRTLRPLGGRKGAGAELELESGRRDRFDAVLVAAGRVPATAGLGLEEAGVECDGRGFVTVDEGLRTARPGVFALGSAVGEVGEWVGARLQAAQALRALRGLPTFEWGDPVRVLGTLPTLAAAGLTPEVCARLDVPFLEVAVPFRAVLRGRARGGEGLLKLVVDAGSRRLLGVHAVGPEADELVHLGAAWMRAERPVDALLEGPFAPGSFAELYALAALELQGRTEDRGGSAGGMG